MSWKDWVLVLLIILGIVLFLYGANYYDQTVGWAGVFLFVGAIVALVLLYVYGALNKKKENGASIPPQNP
jgi:drug/metabolite transporter (DMT)-like permease